MLASGDALLLSPVVWRQHGQLALESRSDPAFPRSPRAPVLSDRSILIAEPESALRATWQSALAAMGFHVSVSASGTAALQIAMHTEISLLITELYLSSGGERCLVRAARREPALRRLKILAVSNHDKDDDRAWALAAGADAYLIKPVRLGHLLQVAGRLATSRRQSRGETRHTPAAERAK
jgi:CheY-like chemotaxis protein